MSRSECNLGGIGWSARGTAPSPVTESGSESDPDGPHQSIAFNNTAAPRDVESRKRNSRKDYRNAVEINNVVEKSTTILSLLKAIRQGNQKRFSVLLERCGPLKMCIECASNRESHCHSVRHDVHCNILNAIIEELLSCSVVSPDIVQALVDSNPNFDDAHETTNGRRLWFWAALNNHANLISHMLAANFEINQGISLSDQSILTNALPQDSDTLPQGITALFAALITNAYDVALRLVKQGAALRLHFHEHRDAYTVPTNIEENKDDDAPVVLDAMMVLAPRFPKSHASQQNNRYLEVVACLLAHGLDPSLPSNLWIKASSIFFMSLSQGRSSHEYVQEISFVLKVALYGQVEIMEVLVDNGADVDAKGFHGLSLLHFATRSTNLDMVECVAELVDDVDVQDDFGYTALHHAVALDLPEIVRCLLESDAEVDIPSKNGLTPLHLAVSLKDIDMCDLLLQHGAEVNTCLTRVVNMRSFNHTVDWYDLTSTEMVFGSTPLMSALCPDKMVYVYTVSTGSNSDTSDTNSMSDITDSLVNLSNMLDDGSEESLFIETTERESDRSTANKASGIRDRLVRMLLEHGARACEIAYFFKKRSDLAKKDGGHDWQLSPFAFEVEWCYPISLAAKTTTEAWSQLTQTSLRNVKGTPDIVRTILDAANSELTPYILNKALSAACFTNMKVDGNGRAAGRFRLSRAVIEMLLDKGADLHQRNNQNLTLLHLACIPWDDGQNQCDLIDRLLKDGAYIETRCSGGKTPLHWAAAYNLNAVEVLLAHGASTFVHDDFKRDPLHYVCSNPESIHDNRGIRLLLQHRYHRESMSGEETCLALACDNEWAEQDCEILHYLVDPELPQHTNSALLVACRKKRVATLAAICQHSQCWQAYSSHGPDGATPVIEAVKSGSSEVVSLILQGISIAYHERKLVPADTFQDHDDDVPGEQQMKYHNSMGVGDSADSTDSEASTTASSFYRPPPKIEGLLYSEQYSHKGQLMFHHKRPTAAELLPLGRNQRGICLNAQDHSGWTALHYAAETGDETIIQLLLDEPDIDLEPSSSLSTTPLEILRASGKQSLIEPYLNAIKSRNSMLRSGRPSGQGESIAELVRSNPTLWSPRTRKWFDHLHAQFKGLISAQASQLVLFLLILIWSVFWNCNLLGISHEVGQTP